MAQIPFNYFQRTADRKYLGPILGLLLVLLTAILYQPAMHNSFVNFDDPDYVTKNPAVLHGISWRNVVWAFGTENPAANWHPFTWISHMLDVQWFGLNPAGHHFTNVLFFSLDVLLLFLFLEKATGRILRSGAVAALFAVHPLNVETAAWIAERKSVLSIFFMLLSLLAYVWYARKPGYARYTAVFVLFALALMAKVMVITLPLAMLLLDYWPLQRCAEGQPGEMSHQTLRQLRALFIEKTPLFLLSVAAGWMTLRIHHKEGALSAVLPLSWRVKNVLFSYVAYLGKIVWPARLAVFYPHPENSLPGWKVAASAALLIGLTLLVLKFREKRYLPMGWLWYLGMLFPMIGLIQSGRQGMADRYICLSLIGALIAGVWLAGDLALRFHVPNTAVAALFVILLCPSIYLTRVQIGFWQNSYTLFAHTLQVTSNNGLAENNFGSALMEMGQAPLAQPHLEAAVRLIPSMGSAHYNLGIALQGQNRLSDAAKQYQLAIANSSDRTEIAQAHNNLGAVYLQEKDMGAAKSEFSAAIAMNPSEANSFLGRGMIEQQGWDYDRAVADFTSASQIAPSPLAYFWLGRALESKGQTRQAENAYAMALQLAPGMPEVRARLAALQASGGK
jgi:tetratricopeptide (TPR) repeat protein